MDERKVKRIYHPLAVPAADLFKSGKQRRVAAYSQWMVKHGFIPDLKFS